MTGIGTIWHRRGGRPAAGDGARMAQALNTYGAGGHYSTRTNALEFVLACGNQASRGNTDPQLITAGGGRWTVLLDGRLDHREELAAALGMPLPGDDVTADAMLAGAAWAKWGEASVGRLYGEFAGIVWDREDQTLFLFRDPFGRRPLHYFSDHDRMVAASMPRGIHAIQGIDRVLDYEKLVDVACGLYLHSTQSCFANVRSVGPGEIVSFTPERQRSQRYYNLEERVQPVRYRSDDDYVEEMRELLDRAIDTTIRGGGQLAVAMSGGLDSTSVAVLAAGRLGGGQDTLPVFTSIPDPDWDGREEKHVYSDERHYAAAVANHCPTLDLQLIDAAGHGIFDVLDRVNAAMEMPQRNIMNAIWVDQLLARARSGGAQTVLEGGMGNAAFSYSGIDAPSQLLRAFRLPALLNQLWEQAEHEPFSALRSAAALSRRELQAMVPRRLREFIVRRSGMMRLPAEARAIRSDRIAEYRVIERATAKIRDDIHLLSGRERDRWMMMLKNHAFAAEGGRLGWKVLHGLEMRDPLADRKLVEWCLGVPDWIFCKGRERRWLAKRAMAGLLPNEVLYKERDIGRQSADWHLRLTRDFDRIVAEIDRFERDPALAELFDFRRLRGQLKDWPSSTPTENSDPGMSIRRELPMVLSIGRFALREIEDGPGGTSSRIGTMPIDPQKSSRHLSCGPPID